eukprot:jgi/Botrbrau1/16859/Bobra.150_2s0079.1
MLRALRKRWRPLAVTAENSSHQLSLSAGVRRCSGPLPAVDDDGNDNYNISSNNLEANSDYYRRLEEMSNAERLIKQNDQLKKPRNSDRVGSFQLSERQKSSSEASCSASALPVADREPAGDESTWRALLRKMREVQGNLQTDHILTDTFGRKHTYLRVSLTERCNLRCLYCMPEEGVDLTPNSGLLTSDEIVHLARIFVEAGVSKIRLTGGEPTLRRDIVELAGRLSSIPGVQALGITSNGIALKRKLADLKANGLNLVNISLDTLRPDRFEQMTRRRGLGLVLDSIEEAVQLGFDPVKVNMVVMRGVNDDEIPDFVELTRSRPINVRFIEYMPFDGNVWSDQKMVPYKDMVTAVSRTFSQGLVRFQDPAGEVAKNFQVPGFKGSVSFITSMSQAFCSDCNRLRIMADGNLKVCLFGANEVSLREALREGASEDDLRLLISAAVQRKKAAHAGMLQLPLLKNRAMVKIGG